MERDFHFMNWLLHSSVKIANKNGLREVNLKHALITLNLKLTGAQITQLIIWWQNNELICEDGVEVGFIGSFIFIGIIVNSFTIMPIPDIIGRKPVLISASLITTICPFLMLFAGSLTSIYILMFLFGLTAAVWSTTAYVYVIEIVPEFKSKLYVSAMILTEKIFWIQVSPLMYLFKDWKFAIIYFSLISFIWTILLFWIPESPIFMKNKTTDNKENEKIWHKRIGR